MWGCYPGSSAASADCTSGGSLSNSMDMDTLAWSGWRSLTVCISVFIAETTCVLLISPTSTMPHSSISPVHTLCTSCAACNLVTCSLSRIALSAWLCVYLSHAIARLLHSCSVAVSYHRLSPLPTLTLPVLACLHVMQARLTLRRVPMSR